MESLAPYMMSNSYKIQNRYVIKRKDPLFWCFFIMRFGLHVYETPGVVSFLREKDEKYRCVDAIRNNKSLLKSQNIHNKDGEIENDIANHVSISMKTFIALCIVYDINVLFIQNQKAYWVADDVKFVVKYYDGCAAALLFDQDIEAIKESHYRWENIERPIKVCSSYSRDELFTMCSKMNLTSEKQTKAEMYSLILSAII